MSVVLFLLYLILCYDISSVHSQQPAAQQSEYWKQRQARSQQYLNEQLGAAALSEQNQATQQQSQSQSAYDNTIQQPNAVPSSSNDINDVQQKQTQSDGVGTSFALRHSFSPPLAAQIPFWNSGAGAIVYSDLIRLTPQQQGRYGYVWNNVISEMSDWSVVLEFQVNGLPSGGADGFAFWYSDKSETIGSVYGSTDYWVGLGIMFDTFNNDNVGRNPIITAVYNDGTKKYDFATDGATQSIGSCPSNYRNLQSPASARITYQNKKLTVDIGTRRDASNQPAYINCFTVDNLELGIDKYFGVSARTGDLSDNHDIISILTTDLSSPTVDLNAIRQQWRSTLAAQQSESNKQHDMSMQEFQGNVLNILQQIQGELNLMELSSLSISEWLHKRLGVEPDNTASTSQHSNSIPQIANLDPNTISKIDATSDQLASIIRLLQQNSGGNNNNANKQIDATQQIKQLTSSSETQFRQLQTNVLQIQNKLNELSTKITTPTLNTSTITSSGIGWINTILLVVSAVMTTVSVIMGWRNNKANARYKLV